MSPNRDLHSRGLHMQPISASACRTASADNDGLHDEDAHSEDAHSEAGCSEAGCSEAGAARQSVYEIETAEQMRDVLSRCALVAGLHPDQVRPGRCVACCVLHVVRFRVARCALDHDNVRLVCRRMWELRSTDLYSASKVDSADRDVTLVVLS